MATNYLASAPNPFKLAAPPQWWLQRLSDYDAELVVFPSRIRMAFILARRRHFSNAYAELDRFDKNMIRLSAGMDGDTLANYNLIYVRHLIGDAIRRDHIFQWLKDHDLKANGGAEAVDNRIVTVEEDAAARKRQRMLDDIDYRAKDAWRSYQARTGRRTGYVSNGSGRAKQMPVQSFTPRESSVAMFVQD